MYSDFFFFCILKIQFGFYFNILLNPNLVYFHMDIIQWTIYQSEEIENSESFFSFSILCYVAIIYPHPVTISDSIILRGVSYREYWSVVIQGGVISHLLVVFSRRGTMLSSCEVSWWADVGYVMVSCVINSMRCVELWNVLSCDISFSDFLLAPNIRTSDDICVILFIFFINFLYIDWWPQKIYIYVEKNLSQIFFNM